MTTKTEVAGTVSADQGHRENTPAPRGDQADPVHDRGMTREILAGAALGAATGGLVSRMSGGDTAKAAALAVIGGLAGAGIAGYVLSVRTKYGVSRAKFARLANVSDRTLSTWERVGAEESAIRTIRELDELYEALSRIVKPEHIWRWLETPNPAFDGLKPLEVIDRGQSGRIWRMIFEIESGTAF